MATFEVTDPSGRVRRIEAPSGTSSEVIAETMLARYYQEEAARAEEERVAALARVDAPVEREEETTLLGNMLRGTGAGAVNMLESAALGLATPLGEESETAARDVIKSVADFVRPRLANPEEVSAKVFQGVGSLAALAPTVFLGPLALPAAAALSTAAGAGEASERAREKGATEEERALASRFGVIPGALDVIPLGRFARAAGVDIGDIPVIGDMINKLGPEAVEGLVSRVQRAGITGGIEGAQEVAQEIGQNLIEKNIYNPDASVLGGTFESGSVGFGSGVIIQGLLDLAIGRRARGPSAPTAPEQAELFPGADLGRAPERLGPEQGELFPSEDLGRAPERPDERQLDLFATPESEAEAYRQRIRAAQLEKERRVRGPIAPFEEAGPPFFERSDVEAARAGAGLASLLRQRQGELQFEDVPGSRAEQVAQAAAREREGLRAAERGDVEAFEQPDLFALQQEQERRRLGPEETRRPDEPVGALEEAAPSRGPRQFELEDEIEIRRTMDEEAATARAEEAAAREVRTASELETIAGQQDTARRATTERNRGAILNSVLTDLGTASRTNVEQRFSKALADAGIADTAPTPAERATIDRATGAVAALRPQREPEVEDRRGVEELEAQIPERRRGAPLRAAPTPTTAPVIDNATLDRLQIPARAPVRNRVQGKALDAPGVREDLLTYANSTTNTQSKRQVERFIREAPAAQAAQQAEAFTGRRAPDEAPVSVFGDEVPVSEFKPSRGRARPADRVRRDRPAGVATTTQVEGTPGRSVAVAGSNVINAVARARGEPAPVDQKVEPIVGAPTPAPTAKPKAAPKQEARRTAVRPTRVQKKPVTEAKKPTGRALSVEEVAKLERAGQVTTPLIKERLLSGNYEVGTETGSEAQRRATILSTDPTTRKDVEAVAKLLGSPQRRGSDAAYAVDFFGKNPNDPVMGLEDLSYAEVYGPEDYRRAPGESDAERARFKGQGRKAAKRARKWVEQNLSEGVQSWIKTSNEDHRRTLRWNKEKFGRSSPDEVAANREGVVDETTAEYLKPLTSDAVTNLGTPLHPAALRELRDGNLQGALRVLVKTSSSDRVANIAGKLLDAVGSTKVEVVNNLKSPDGTPLAGLFDPKTNTIKIDPRMANTHTLLHEATHMAVSATLAKPGHPVTKQLTKLFETAKGSLENHYAARSVDEFVSEAFSNPEFQAELAQLNESGKPVSVLQQFMNIVGNFLRRMVGLQPKGISSALNATDRMVESIISPAPNARSADELFMLSRFGGAAKVLNNALDNMPPITKDGAEKFVNFIKDRNIPLRARQALQYVTPLHGATEIAEKYIPGASKLNEIVRRQSGVINKGQEAIDAVIKGISSWGRSNPEKLAIFDELVVLSTSGEVDPELSRADAQKKYGSDPERMKDWDAAKRMFEKIGEGGRTQYRTLRNTYKSLLGDIQSTLRKRLRDEVGDAEGQAIYNEINKALVANGAIDPYFPLFRRGEYWVTYTATNPRTGKPDFFAEAFESKSAAQTAIKELKATGGATDINEYTSRGQIDYSKAPATAFVNDILKTMKVNGIEPKKKASDPDTLADQVLRLYLDSIPERSMLQGFRQRKGTPGAKKDAVLALRNKGMGIVRQLAQIEHGRDIQQYRNEIDEYVKAQKQKPDVDLEQSALLDNIKEDLDRRARFAASPNISNWSKFGSSLGFNFTLGFNVSSALVNLTALPMIVYPYLAGKYGGPGVAGAARGYAEASRAMGIATKIFMSSGRERQIETYGPDGTSKVKRTVSAAPSIDNYNFDAANTPPEIKMRRALAEVAAEQGMLNRSITQDVLDMEGMDSSAASALQKVNMASGFMFHHLERAQRQISLDAAYQMELSKRAGVPVNELGAAYASGKISDADMQAAAREAVYITEMTNGGVQAAGAPPVSQNNIGRIAFMFKRYGVSMYYMLWKLSENSIKGSPADKAMARRQLAGVFGATGLLAGVGGMPIFGTMAMIANMFLEDDEEDFQTMTRQYLGEGVYGGLGNYLFGVDVSARIGLSELLFRENRIAKDQSIFFTALEELGGPVVGVGMGIERGLDMISQGDTVRGLEAMAPAAIRNTMKGIRFATEGANTMRGDSIVDDIGIGHSLAQMLGFAPAEYSRQLMENAALKKIDRTVAKERTNILRRLYIAARSGDSEGVRDAVERLRRFNSRHANAAITADSVKRSMKSHQKTSAEMHHGITLNKNMRATLQAEARDFDKNVSIWD